MEFKDSDTYKNLKAAFEGELMASSKYEIYGLAALEEGFEQIGNIFDETSRNEREHAELWLKQLNGGKIPNTYKNLESAAAGENYEWTKMYKNYAVVARNEGYTEIAELFEGVANIEKSHDRRFSRLLKNLETDKVFCKHEEKLWVCLNCGNLFRGKCAPEKCPVCSYPQGFYEIYCDNY